MNFSVNQLVGDAPAVVDHQLHHGNVLPSIGKGHRILLVGENVMAVGADLPDIVAAEGNVAFQRGFPVFIRRQNFQQPIGRDDAAVCCGQILSSIEAKGDG